MVNRRGPSLPWRSLNPLTGIRDVPVVNCSNRDFFSASHVRIACLSAFILRVGEGIPSRTIVRRRRFQCILYNRYAFSNRLHPSLQFPR
jgi:hypothetical protein